VVSALIASKYVDVSKLTQPGSTFDNVNARNSVKDLTPLVKYTFDFFWPKLGDFERLFDVPPVTKAIFDPALKCSSDAKDIRKPQRPCSNEGKA
jgi:hypothetical protein